MHNDPSTQMLLDDTVFQPPTQTDIRVEKAYKRHMRHIRMWSENMDFLQVERDRRERIKKNQKGYVHA